MSEARVARFAMVGHEQAQEVAARLMSRLRVEGECWVWTGCRNPGGYGHMRVNGRVEKAHAVAVFLRHGADVLRAETVNHLCFNRLCCNPDHLQVASKWENTLHGASPSAHHAAKTHCQNGHALEGENIAPRSDGRRCRECKRISSRKYEVNRRRRHTTGEGSTV